MNEIPEDISIKIQDILEGYDINSLPKVLGLMVVAEITKAKAVEKKRVLKAYRKLIRMVQALIRGSFMQAVGEERAAPEALWKDLRKAVNDL